MRNKAIEYLQNNISSIDADFANYIMKKDKVNLQTANEQLYNNIKELLDKFVETHELSENWIEENFIDIDDILNYLLSD